MHDADQPCHTPTVTSRLRTACAVALALLVSGCASYAPLPLGSGEGAADVAQLTAPTSRMPLPSLATHRFDPADGLDVTETAMLAVANSPPLKLKRDELGIARAQAFAAGLLPDPQLSLGEDFPQHSGGGLTTAFNLGLSEDVTALLTRSSRKAAARSQAQQVNLDLLWAEWQTVAQARLLFDQVLNLRAQQARLASEQAALEQVTPYIQSALDAGNLSYDSASAGLNAAADVRRQLADNAVALHQADSDLHVLLGLAPTATLDLAGAPYRVAPTPAQLQQALADLPRRRPDLLALQAGYQSQQEKLRTAVLAQFPALNIGFNTARDTGAVYTRGFTVGITLPLFDRNRGNIAIERATRQQLKDDYESRVLTTRSDMQRLAADLATLAQHEQRLAAHTQQLDAARRIAEQSWRQGLLDWPTWLAIRSQSLAADLELLAVQQQQATQSIALEALLGNTALAAPGPSAPAQAPTP
ncbi:MULTISPECIES: TolC family protein [Rhodanobacter]|uniref:TolC family protein n=1 Tax=Rhodanobacter TaxID=75309 RepID=UPI000481ADE0|nr:MULTISPECIES: TolC family protein [Rhodanobacter]TAN17861.1 MAG: TolC family protein [Rhodanobacter sp.]UJJ54993.1 TolC family protein [Rhodanobacter thiooxydans]